MAVGGRGAAWYLERDLDGTLGRKPPRHLRIFAAVFAPRSISSSSIFFTLCTLFRTGQTCPPFYRNHHLSLRTSPTLLFLLFPFFSRCGSMLRENGPFRLIVNYNKQTVSRIRAEFNIAWGSGATDGRFGGLPECVLPVTIWGVHAFFVQQAGMESGIDIKFPFCALAASRCKAPEREGDHHRGDSDDVRARRECHINAGHRETPLWGSDVGTFILCWTKRLVPGCEN